MISPGGVPLRPYPEPGHPRPGWGTRILGNVSARGLAGTRFEDLYIAKKRDGVYQLGATSLVAVQAAVDRGSHK